MTWAIALAGRSGNAATLLLFDDRREAESIAAEIRTGGRPVIVVPHPWRPQATANRN
jgi:hypothetical protein